MDKCSVVCCRMNEPKVNEDDKSRECDNHIVESHECDDDLIVLSSVELIGKLALMQNQVNP